MKKKFVRNIVTNESVQVSWDLSYLPIADFFEVCNENCLPSMTMWRYLPAVDTAFKN